jgi:flagellin
VGGALQITTASFASSAISIIDSAIDKLSLNRADVGAFQNRLTSAVDNLTSWQTNLSTSRGRIVDADYAKTTTELARQQIIQQAAQAMLVQANMDPRTVLALLK